MSWRPFHGIWPIAQLFEKEGANAVSVVGTELTRSRPLPAGYIYVLKSLVDRDLADISRLTGADVAGEFGDRVQTSIL